MVIQITSGVSTGPTKMAAFDSALKKAGIANYNLICLSSIIPPGTKIKETRGPAKNPPGGWGDRLYIVKADKREETPNVEAWAGIGWVQDKKTGKGLFVESEGKSKSTVRKDITESLKAMVKNRRENFGSIKMKVVGITCEHEPVCAIVVAVYQASDWKQ